MIASPWGTSVGDVLLLFRVVVVVVGQRRQVGIDALVERARRIPELGAARVILNDPTDALLPHHTEELVERMHQRRERDMGVGYGSSSGYGAAKPSYVRTWRPGLFTFR